MNKIVLAVTAFCLVSVSAFSAAYAMRGGLPGYGHGMYENPGQCMNGLTQQEQQTVLDKKNSFLNETRSLRKEIFEKRMVLEKEIVKKNPDQSKVKQLRKNIYSLRKNLESKRADHIEKLNEIIPGFEEFGFRNNMRKGTMGRGNMMNN
ncbi:MAG: periplasmic heavy metal sensor [Thermodesulfobacteriota bacterium]